VLLNLPIRALKFPKVPPKGPSPNQIHDERLFAVLLALPAAYEI
jgi:hypothetical protein